MASQLMCAVNRVFFQRRVHAMNSELKIQIKRMQTILARQKRPIHRSKAAKSQTFDTMKAKTGIVLDKVTRDFFRFSNGSNGDLWAAVESDELQPLAFLALEEALSDWALFSPVTVQPHSVSFGG
jgi:hypothetical protein